MFNRELKRQIIYLENEIEKQGIEIASLTEKLAVYERDNIRLINKNSDLMAQIEILEGNNGGAI